MQAPERSPSARWRLLQGVARSRRWLQHQRSSRADTELGTFDFLVLCFEQISIAGAAMNCYRSVSSSSSSFSSFSSSSSSSSSDNNSAALFPETFALLPLASLTIVFFSALVVWGSPWFAGCCKSGCCCSRRRDGEPTASPLCSTRRHAMPVITVVLKITFLVYVVGMLNRSPAFELKQQLGDLLAALLLLLCELVDMFALLHTWWVEFRRARADPLTIAAVGARHEEQMSARKRFVLTFFDRWKDCGTVSSFLSQNELLLLSAEVPSMALAAWTACAKGNTPDRLSYHLHRVLTMMTIVMGTLVLDPSPQLSPDIQGAVVFLVADVALSSLNLYNGRVRNKRSAPASSPIPSEDEESDDDSATKEAYSSLPSGDASCTNDDPVMPSERPATESTAAPSSPSASIAAPSQTGTQALIRQTSKLVVSALRSISGAQWAKAAIDCVFVVSVVLNFFETLSASKVQSFHQQSSSGSDDAELEHMQDQVNTAVIIVDCLLGSILILSLVFRWVYAYTSFSSASSHGEKGCLRIMTRTQLRRNPRDSTRVIELVIQCVKLALLGISIYVFGVVMVQHRLLVVKDGINSLIAYMVGMVTIANLADAFGRALTHGVDGSSLVSAAPTFMVEGGRVTALGKLNTAIQVLWDRLNDFLCPLSIVHVLIYSGNVAANFAVFYLVLCVCVLHAAIAFLDRTDVTGASYVAERFGYLVGVSFMVINSSSYIPRSGADVVAPTLLVFINFAQLLVSLISEVRTRWRGWRQRRQASRASRARRIEGIDRGDSLEAPILSSISEDHADFSASERRLLWNRRQSSESQTDATPTGFTAEV